MNIRVFLLSSLCTVLCAKLTVHLVPHTHDDAGWLKTVDEYFSGANNSIQHAAVRNILDSVTAQLELNADRKFTYVEQAFFQRWWRELNDKRRAMVRKLVASGQLNFVNGGWCMHDEAAVHYVDMIDQTTLGHRLLLEEFGVVPTVGWQLDPFGHSAVQAALLSAEAGFDSLFIGRIDYQDLDLRHKGNNSEFVWRASPSLGVDAQIFSGLAGEYGGNYGPPPGFDWNNDDEPVEDNPALDTYNVPSRVNDFIEQAMNQAKITRGENIMFTMGSDFQYENAEPWFRNMDRIIDAVNKDGRITARYSSPMDYVAAKRAESTVTWPLKAAPDGDDFFPYADNPHEFWTGYFTSRPALKGYIRKMSAMQNAVRQVQALAGLRDFDAVGALSQLQRLEEAQGVAQHHDAAAGTAKQHVTFDYAKRIAAGGIQAEGVLSAGLSTLAGTLEGTWGQCARLNETVCPDSQSGGSTSTVVAIWNQLAHVRTEHITIPVSSSDVHVQITGTSEVLPVRVYDAPETITNYKRSTGETAFMASFQVTLPPVGFQTVTVTQGKVASATPPLAVPTRNADVVLENELLSLTFSGATGLLSAMENKITHTKISVVQYFCYYVGNEGDKQSDQNSGAYIFRPDATGDCHMIDLNGTKPTITTVMSGGVLHEVRQTFALQPDSEIPWLTQTVRLGDGERFAQFEFTVGEIPTRAEGADASKHRCVAWRNTGGCNPDGPHEPKNDKDCSTFIKGSDSGYCECEDGRRAAKSGCGHASFTCADQCSPHTGKEVVSRFNTSIMSSGKILTDSNGRDMLLRMRDARPSWKFQQTEPVAGNYYPINSAVAIKDPFAQFTVLVDRSQGAGSVADGVLELMVHRRLLKDDARGVGEPLDETQFVGSYAGPEGGVHSGPGLIVRGTHYVTLEPPATAAAVWRPLADRVFAPPLIIFKRSGGSSPTMTSFKALIRALPTNVELMTLQALSQGKLLLRLSHQFGLGEDKVLSNLAAVDLAALFDPKVLVVTAAREVSLTNNQNKSQILAQRARNMLWRTADNTPQPHAWRALPFDFQTNSTVLLGPLEIKTFVLTVQAQTFNVLV